MRRMHFFQKSTVGLETNAQAFRLLNPVYGCTRADMFRYLIMFLEGGLYFDCKSGCENPDKFAGHAPLAPLVVTHWGHATHPERITHDPFKKGEKCNWAFASVPGHPIWIEVMNAITQAIFRN